MKIDETITDKIPLYVKRVADVLLENGFEAYLVGGSVRDLLTGKEPGDFRNIIFYDSKKNILVGGIEKFTHIAL